MPSPFSRRKIKVLLLAASLPLLTSCGIGRFVCPSPPAPPVMELPGESFQPRMQDFLSGRPPEPTDSAPTSTPVKSGSKP